MYKLSMMSEKECRDFFKWLVCREWIAAAWVFVFFLGFCLPWCQLVLLPGTCNQACKHAALTNSVHVHAMDDIFVRQRQWFLKGSAPWRHSGRPRLLTLAEHVTQHAQSIAVHVFAWGVTIERQIMLFCRPFCRYGLQFFSPADFSRRRSLKTDN